MSPEEKQLIYYLNYELDESDVFIRAEAILWFQEKFLGYWEAIDKKINSNNLQIINELYRNNATCSLEKIAQFVGLHVRSLNRYREKFIKKMKELINEYQYILKRKKLKDPDY